MDIIVTLEYRFKKTPDGHIWTQMAFDYPFWRRYLEVFDTVHPCARVESVQTIDESKWRRVDGPNVEPITLEHYVGPVGLLKARSKIKAKLKEVANMNCAFIMRVGSPIADVLQPMLAANSIPYGLEVVGDPWEVFRPRAIRHPLRPLMRLWFMWKLKRQCARASCVSYVTDQALQARYPAIAGAYTIGASTIDLSPDHFAKTHKTPKELRNFVYVGTLETLQKGPDTLIKSFAQFHRLYPDATLTIVGDGRERPELETLMQSLGVSKAITITGTIPAGDAVRAKLDAADLFVLPSRGEGLPRSMIEAMARGLPCIGTHIGGIAELLPEKLRVNPGDDKALASLMLELANKPEQLEDMAKRNLTLASKYLASNLRPKRKKFYQEVKDRRVANNA